MVNKETIKIVLLDLTMAAGL